MELLWSVVMDWLGLVILVLILVLSITKVLWCCIAQYAITIFPVRLYNYRSHPEMVDDMLRVTLNFDLSKIPFVHF